MNKNQMNDLYNLIDSVYNTTSSTHIKEDAIRTLIYAIDRREKELPGLFDFVKEKVRSYNGTYSVALSGIVENVFGIHLASEMTSVNWHQDFYNYIPKSVHSITGIMKRVLDNVEFDQMIEMGSGTGMVSSLFDMRYDLKKLKLIEYDPFMVEWSKNRIKYLYKDLPNRFEFIHGDLTKEETLSHFDGFEGFVYSYMPIKRSDIMSQVMDQVLKRVSRNAIVIELLDGYAIKLYKNKFTKEGYSTFIGKGVRTKGTIFNLQIVGDG